MFSTDSSPPPSTHVSHSLSLSLFIRTFPKPPRPYDYTISSNFHTEDDHVWSYETYFLTYERVRIDRPSFLPSYNNSRRRRRRRRFVQSHTSKIVLLESVQHTTPIQLVQWWCLLVLVLVSRKFLSLSLSLSLLFGKKEDEYVLQLYVRRRLHTTLESYSSSSSSSSS